MKVREARALAARWVAAHAATVPGFAGAFLSGSVIWLPSECELPATSDVDLQVVTDGDPPPKLGKLPYGGTLVDVSFLSWEQLDGPERVLGSYHLAGSFRTDTLLADPTGRLAGLRDRVAGEWAAPAWVRRRCEDAERRILDRLDEVDPALPLYDQVLAWLFATGVTTHVLLTAGLRNPTVRLRYVAVRDLLHEHGRRGFHPELLAQLGYADLSRASVERHLKAMTAAFDATATVARSPLPFAADITAAARPVAVDGSRVLVARGDHREAVFWIVATYARCLPLLHADAPALLPAFAPGFDALLADLGIASPADLPRRARQLRAFLPRLAEVRDTILAANPAVLDHARNSAEGRDSSD
jgi:hypothetical protein